MKVWITKYVLTEGIQELDVDPPSQDIPTLIRHPDGYPCYHGEGGDWHRSRDAALVRAETVRQKKIKAVKKQLERLERMTF